MARNTLPIVVGVDGSPSSILALRQAVELSRVLNAPLRAVTAWQSALQTEAFELGVPYNGSAEARQVQQEALAAVLDNAALANVDQLVVEGPSAEVLIAQSGAARMLVVGSRGHGAVAGLLLGSVSTACAERASCPVLVAH